MRCQGSKAAPALRKGLNVFVRQKCHYIPWFLITFWGREINNLESHRATAMSRETERPLCLPVIGHFLDLDSVSAPCGNNTNPSPGKAQKAMFTIFSLPSQFMLGSILSCGSFWARGGERIPRLFFGNAFLCLKAPSDPWDSAQNSYAIKSTSSINDTWGTECSSLTTWNQLGITQSDHPSCCLTQEGQGEVGGAGSSFLWLLEGGYYLNVVSACDHHWLLIGFISWGLGAFCQCQPFHCLLTLPIC